MALDITTGGLRDRLIRDAAAQVINDGLDALGWFGVGRHHKPVVWLDEPVPETGDITIPDNAISCTGEDIPVGEELELGSNLMEYRHVFYVDFYAGGEDAADVGRQVIGDVRAILEGKMPAAGRDRAVIEVYDVTQDPVPAEPAFTLLVQAVETDRARNTTRVFEANWFMCRFELVDER